MGNEWAFRTALSLTYTDTLPEIVKTLANANPAVTFPADLKKSTYGMGDIAMAKAYLNQILEYKPKTDVVPGAPVTDPKATPAAADPKVVPPKN